MQQRLRFGRVTAYDSDAGLGTVRADDATGERDPGAPTWTFHCTAIADGSREIDPGTAVVFQVRAAGPGAWEAFGVRPVSPG